MPWRASSRGDRGKAHVYGTSYKDSSSDDETVFDGEQMAQVLPIYFDHVGDDIKPTGRIPKKTRSRRWRSAERVSASSESHIISTRTSSRCTPVMERAGSSEAMMAEDLIFDLEADLLGEEGIELDLSTQQRSLRPRFPPRQAGTDAYTGVGDDNIRDTHLLWGLKGHLSAQAWKGQVCCLHFLSSRFLLNACANR